MVTRSHEVFQKSKLMVSQTVFDKTLELHQLDEVLFLLNNELKTTSVLLLEGDLGAGKTTFTKALLSQRGIIKEVSSPTFNIVNTYKTEEGFNVHHFDLYRIKHIEELDEIGFWEYLDSGDLCIIEWPEMIEDYLDVDYLKLQIKHCGEQQRQYLLMKLS
jgi:tRNA threonylcarbamoyladenosine biosynthesis protein TsaE